MISNIDKYASTLLIWSLLGEEWSILFNLIRPLFGHKEQPDGNVYDRQAFIYLKIIEMYIYTFISNYSYNYRMLN